MNARLGIYLAAACLTTGLTPLVPSAATAASAHVTPHFAGTIRWDFNHLRQTHGRGSVGADACLRAVAVRDLRATMSAHRPAVAESAPRSAARCGATTLTVSWVHAATPHTVVTRLWSRPYVRKVVLNPSTRELTVVRGATSTDRWTLLVTDRGHATTSTHTPTPSSNKTALRAAAPPANTAATVRAALLSKINTYRASHGLNPLHTNSCLQGFAQPWANQLIYNYSHNATDPMWQSCGFNFATENLAMDTNATTVMGEWETSRVHNENLLNPNLTSVGIGVWLDAWGNVAAVADFGGFYPA